MDKEQKEELQTDPKTYGLPQRTQLQLLSENHLAIVKKRKSRIIMKDGRELLSIKQLIQKKSADMKVSLIVSGPVCSKTKALFKEEGLDVIQSL